MSGRVKNRGDRFHTLRALVHAALSNRQAAERGPVVASNKFVLHVARSADAAERALLAMGKMLNKAPVSAESRAVLHSDQSVNDAPYRDRWAHDKVVRPTHGVNWRGSCSWKVYVKDGLITWETQATGYTTTGPDRPEYQPRGWSARRLLLMVHLLAHPGPLPARTRRARRAVPGGQAAARRPGGGLGRDHHRPGQAAALPVGARQGRPGARRVGRGPGDRRRGPPAHAARARPGPDRRLLAHPRHVDGLARGRSALPRADRRADALLLRLVRGPAGGLAAGVRRPDGRAGVWRLVVRGVPDVVGFQRPRHPHPGRPLHD